MSMITQLDLQKYKVSDFKINNLRDNRFYDYDKAKQFCEKYKDSAQNIFLYMSTDYFATAVKIWSNVSGYLLNLNDPYRFLAEMNNDPIAIPSIQIVFSQNTVRNYPCFKKITDPNELRKMAVADKKRTDEINQNLAKIIKARRIHK